MAREIWLSKCKEASKTPTAGESSASTNPTSAPLTSGAAALGSPSTLIKSLATTSISDEDLFAGMTDRQRQKVLEQRRWDQELPNMTKAPKRRSERSEGSLVSLEPFSTIKANYFKLGFDPSIKLYRYSISLGFIEIIAKDKGESRRYLPTNRDTKRYLINSMLLQPNSKPSPVPGVVWASDFDSTIISAGELYPGLTVASPTQVVRHTRTGQDGSTPLEMESQVRYLGVLTFDDLIKHCSSPCNSAADYLPNEDLKALNIISWKNINSDSFRGGRRGNKFYPESLLNAAQEANRDGRCYMIRTGFFSSMRPGQDSVLLNVNTTTSAFYSPILLSTWIGLVFSNGWLDLTNVYKRSKVQNKLKGVKVVFTAEALNRQRKRAVFDISEKTLSETYFARDKNQSNPTSVLTYMKTKYPSHAQHFRGNDYCINLGSRSDKQWYPAELLRIVDWQPVTRVLDRDQADEMIDIAQKNPRENQSRILNYALPLLGLTGQNIRFYQDFGITFDVEPRFTQIKPFFCTAPRLEFNSLGKNHVIDPIQAAWSLGSQFFESKLSKTQQSRLGVLWLCEPPQGTKLDLLEKTMKALGMGGEKGLIFVHTTQSPPAFDSLTSNSTSPKPSAPKTSEPKYRTKCQQVFRQGLDMLNKDGKVLLIIVVLQDHDKNLYAEIKRWGDCVQGIPTSCITLDKLEKCKTVYKVCANFALKINLKLKGVSHHVTVPCCGADESTMIIGADVTHPSPENAAKGCPSIAAVVATNDDINNLYLGSARLQKGKQEASKFSNLKGMVHERLAAWYRKHKAMNVKPEKKLPANIIFYRDGVSESQFGMVRSEEMPQIKAACKTIFQMVKRAEILLKISSYKPKITIIVVTKRHHTRFYPKDEYVTSNIDPGLVIDTDVVTPNQFSFYLQSHSSPLGTARSSHYVVLEDGQNFRETPSKLHKITNNICYVSARATQALSICTPARYADILCDRLRCYLKPSMDRQDTHKPANVPDQTAAAFDPDGDYSQMYGDDEFVWKCPVGEDARKNPWHENMNDVMFYL
ncbi:hypothetical protein EYC84_011148 [Monilinia fructicola]|uniref:Piwi domain-containing protein n=1 Tax=Monilinia fructicola TaxID=38448 RepID=A0A5M9J8N6_MONFR|nr:hypothetical protein EYC84_011148 [Monilinia fructicola]